jgi:rare lipoprotein A
LTCIAAALLLLSACGGHKTARSHPVPPPPTITPAQPAPPATATTEPAPAVPHNAKPIYVETGLASWYGPPYNHRRGANGEIYDQNAMTAAHRTLPLNSMVRVTNLTTGHVAMVRITDRGPFVEDRIVDLSLAAARAVDVWQPGTAEVKLEVLSAPAPIAQGGRWCVQIGAFHSEGEARKMKEKLQDRQRYPVHWADRRVGAYPPGRRRQAGGRRSGPQDARQRRWSFSGQAGLGAGSKEKGSAIAPLSCLRCRAV